MNWIIVGLGNPGEEYRGTRHNAGRETLATLVKNGLLAEKSVTIVFPDTFMNQSGRAVKPLIKNLKAAERLVVLRDDLDLPLGRGKMVFNRGAGGHKGVESISRAIKTQAFIQIKIGLTPRKKPRGPAAVQKFILGKFRPAELAVLKKLHKKIAGALTTLLTAGRERAMSEFN